MHINQNDTTRPREEVLLTIENLVVKRGNTTILHSIDLAIQPHEIVAVVGESGCGKSTTMNAILGTLDKKHWTLEGRIGYKGVSLFDADGQHKIPLGGNHIVPLFQNPGLYLNPTMRIEKQFQDYISHHAPQADWLGLTKEGLINEGLHDAERILSSYPFELSGGMRQRVGTAMALALTPSLLIADEPTSALDTVHAHSLLKRLKELNQEKGIGMLFITHNIKGAAFLAHRIYVMQQGRIVESGTSEQIMNDPKEAYTKELLAAVPTVEM